MTQPAYSEKPFRICFFGTYDSHYPGNAVLIESLRRNGAEVIECHVPLWEKTPVKDADYYSLRSLVRLAARVLVAMARLLTRVTRMEACPVIIAGFNGYLDLPVAKLVALLWKSKLVFNPMMSMYDTLVLDRKYFPEGSLGARLILWSERALYRLPDVILLDSKVHYEFFADRLNCPWSKFRQLWFGADDRVFYVRPSEPPDGRFRVLFYGKYQPLQGVMHIVEAAKQLESDPAISFLLIGHGPTRAEVERRAQELKLQSVRFVEWVDLEQLPEVIAKADVCLGIFGTSEKVNRCVANKVVQALAMRKPVITGYTDAMGEMLTHREHLLFCERGSPQGLAEGIVELKQDADLRRHIANQGYDLFSQLLSPLRMGALARAYLEDLIKADPQAHAACGEQPNEEGSNP